MSRNVALVVLDTVRKGDFDEYAPRLRATSHCSFEGCRGLDPDRPSRQRLLREEIEIPEADCALFEADLETYKRAVSVEAQDTDFDDDVADRLEELGYL